MRPLNMAKSASRESNSSGGHAGVSASAASPPSGSSSSTGRSLISLPLRTAERAHSVGSGYPSPQSGYYGPQMGDPNSGNTHSFHPAGSPNFRDRPYPPPHGTYRHGPAPFRTPQASNRLPRWKPGFQSLPPSADASNGPRPLGTLLQPQPVQVSEPSSARATSADAAEPTPGDQSTTTAVPNEAPAAPLNQHTRSPQGMARPYGPASMMRSPQHGRRDHRRQNSQSSPQHQGYWQRGGFNFNTPYGEQHMAGNLNHIMAAQDGANLTAMPLSYHRSTSQVI